MFQTRIHGRGGQGVVTAAELLSFAAFRGGHHAQAFPSFGSERMGAPVVSYCRIADSAIRTREPIVVPDALIIQDPTLLHQVDVLSGLPQRAYVLINSTAGLDELGLEDYLQTHDPERVMTVSATEIAMRHLGRPLPNLVLLGGFAALTGLVTIDDVCGAASDLFGGTVLSNNQAAAREAYEIVAGRGSVHA